MRLDAILCDINPLLRSQSLLEEEAYMDLVQVPNQGKLRVRLCKKQLIHHIFIIHICTGTPAACCSTSRLRQGNSCLASLRGSLVMQEQVHAVDSRWHADEEVHLI